MEGESESVNVCVWMDEQVQLYCVCVCACVPACIFVLCNSSSLGALDGLSQYLIFLLSLQVTQTL